MILNGTTDRGAELECALRLWSEVTYTRCVSKACRNARVHSGRRSMTSLESIRVAGDNSQTTMKCHEPIPLFLVLVLLWAGCAGPEVEISGELKRWHKVTLTIDGPEASETDSPEGVNPFTDYAMTVRFEHESGSPSYEVPGYFAADGMAAETSATAGNKWRAHVSPDQPGVWNYEVSFSNGPEVAVGGGGEPVSPFDGAKGQFTVAASDKAVPDFRARGRLEYVGERYLKFAGDGSYFLKAGPDAPETFLAYEDFDGTSTQKTAAEDLGTACSGLAGG